MNYELYMRAALAEAALAAQSGERPDGAVALLNEALVAHGHEMVIATGDPTAHAVMVAIREAARRLGRRSLAGMTLFVTVEPCAMCTGALLQADADAVVYALADPREGACGSALRVSDAQGLPRRLQVISGILQEDAGALRPDLLTVRSSR